MRKLPFTPDNATLLLMEAIVGFPHRQKIPGALPCLFASLVVLVSLARAVLAQTPSPQAERTLFTLTNSIRAQYRLPPLSWDPALAAAARAHAGRLLRESGPLEHQNPGEPDLVARAAQAGAHFSTVSENLARRGTTPAELEQTWMATPVHRTNLLDPHLTSTGVGVLVWNGRLYAVQDFIRAAPVLSTEQIEAHISSLLRSQGLTSISTSSFARTICKTRATTAPDARLIVQWEGDTSQLPEVLLQNLQRQQFHRAVVGTCPSATPSSSFTSGRVAVLLF